MNKDSEHTNKKTNYLPILPKDGSEDPTPLCIPLQNFKLRHDTFRKSEKEENSIQDLDDTEQDNDFIGRKNLLTQLEKLLENTAPRKKGSRKSRGSSRGSYLISGYRGSGKTSLINRVIKKYKREKKEVLDVRINLGHDEVLDTRHVLF